MQDSDLECRLEAIARDARRQQLIDRLGRAEFGSADEKAVLELLEEVATLKRKVLDNITRHEDVEAQIRRDAGEQVGVLRDELEQARCQLAGCGVASLGGTKNTAQKGDWGWSPAYQDTLDLRLKYEAANQRVGTLTEAINKVWEVASGECQVAMDDTQGMEWISDYLSSIEDISEAVAALASTAPVAEAVKEEGE